MYLTILSQMKQYVTVVLQNVIIQDQNIEIVSVQNKTKQKETCKATYLYPSKGYYWIQTALCGLSCSCHQLSGALYFNILYHKLCEADVDLYITLIIKLWHCVIHSNGLTVLKQTQDYAFRLVLNIISPKFNIPVGIAVLNTYFTFMKAILFCFMENTFPFVIFKDECLMRFFMAEYGIFFLNSGTN